MMPQACCGAQTWETLKNSPERAGENLGSPERVMPVVGKDIDRIEKQRAAPLGRVLLGAWSG